LRLPGTFINSIKNAEGFDAESFEKVHQSGEQVTSIRINPSKNPALTNTLTPAITVNEPVPWSSFGYYLHTRPSFTSDPLFHAGAYYVQEASSMFLEQALRQTADLSTPLKVLDLCAAPGGKSTLIQSLINERSLLVSNEVIKTRVNILSENITKWGAVNVIVTNNDPKDFQRLKEFFDVIVVDAPCSGSGLFRKDPAAMDEWSEQNVQLCSQRQQRILADIFPSLKEGGVLIYSTCSYSTEEDEMIADWFADEFDAQSVRLQTNPEWNIVESQSKQHNTYGYRFYPDKVKGEGFFITAFKKTVAENDVFKTAKNKNKPEDLTAKEIEGVKQYLNAENEFFFIKQNEEAIAIPCHFENDLMLIQSALYIKKAGVRLGAIIRNELIPHHELALSCIINEEVPAVDVDEETALQYLRKQDVKIDTNLKGWALVSYSKLPLGWIKILPGRVNNYYPKEWRILNK
jgi:NOL1/NOP2/sun family putative RNA methylase